VDARALRHVFGFDRRSDSVTTTSKVHFDKAFKPFPTPTGEFPFHLDLEDVLGAEETGRIGQAGNMVFHAVGDTVTGQRIEGEYFAVLALPDHLSDQHPARGVDTFTVTL